MELDEIYKINRKHNLDENYFKEIDSEEKAYWLGFIWADGGLSKTAKRCSDYNRLTLAQHESRIAHLEKFRKAINTNYAIKPQPKNIVSIDINSIPFCNNLIKLGYGKKEHRTNIPKMPKQLISHFIRGYFDGDGCLSIYEQIINKYVIHRQEWSLTGNSEFLNNIAEILQNEVGVSSTVKIKTYKRTDKAVTLRYGKIADIANLYHYLYDNASIYLNEKREKFITFFKNHPDIN